MQETSNKYCAQLYKGITVIDEATVSCCDNVLCDNEVNADDEDHEFLDAISELATEKAIDIRIFHFVIKQKNALIKELHGKINLLNEHIEWLKNPSSNVSNHDNKEKETAIEAVIATASTSAEPKKVLVTAVTGDKETSQEGTSVVRKPRRKLTIVGEQQQNGQLRLAPKMHHLHVYRLHPDTEINDIVDFLKADFPEIQCEALPSKHPEEYSSFKWCPYSRVFSEEATCKENFIVPRREDLKMLVINAQSLRSKISEFELLIEDEMYSIVAVKSTNTLLSDHLGIVLKASLPSSLNNCNTVKKIRPITDNGKGILFSLLEFADWDFIHDASLDINCKFEKFIDVISEKCDRAFPEIKVKYKSKNSMVVNWFDKDLLLLKNKLRILDDNIINNSCASRKHVDENSKDSNISSDAFNDFFSSIASELAKGLPDKAIDPINIMMFHCSDLDSRVNFAFSEVSCAEI
ncbi:hypothetical protein TcasGA2_TC006836 [Tribolium castaneum]|uniref:Uncharacterized protein n=1 Tax=Tribolium castaneum TaxID=7070 RepID=D7EI22_TRICA|nr:hypothetical protein TcasGA2_TC006836 [Tribolium castaneum]